MNLWIRKNSKTANTAKTQRSRARYHSDDMSSAMQDLGYECTGGENSPYIWVNAREDSWGLFDTLLHSAGVVCTPGSGFGKCGEGYIRFSAFNSHAQVQKAMDRVRDGLR